MGIRIIAGIIAGIALATAIVAEPLQSDRRSEPGIVRISTRLPGGAVAEATGTHLGNGWILTCSHCCESSSGRVRVRVLSGTDWKPARSVGGTIVCFDDESDLGLIRLDRDHKLRTAYELAPQGYRLRENETVWTYDWTRQLQLYAITRRITGLNLYEGAETIETDGLPKAGASGGPVVSARDRLIVGVTTSGNLDHQRGIHTGLEPIYRLFRRCRTSRHRSVAMRQ